MPLAVVVVAAIVAPLYGGGGFVGGVFWGVIAGVFFVSEVGGVGVVVAVIVPSVVVRHFVDFLGEGSFFIFSLSEKRKKHLHLTRPTSIRSSS